MRLRFLLSLIVILIAWPVAAQEVRLELSEPDTSEFPTVRLTVRPVGANNAPLTEADLGNLRLRENGIPISDFDLRYVPVGSDIIIVIDADSTLLFEDVGENFSRLEMVKEGIGRYAGRFMNPSGLDQVTVIVPDGTNTQGEFLIEGASSPADVVNALADYEPRNPAEAGPVNEMLLEALAYAEAQAEDGRYQTILLLSEARRLSQFLEYETLLEAATEADVPFFVGILGPEANLEDIGNASALADPTGGFYVHAPNAERLDPVYLRWQQESNQPQLTYRSLLRESGTYPISVNIGTATAATELNLRLVVPTLEFLLERSVIRRVGTAEDTPLAELQPTVQPLPVQINWLDGFPRQLTAVTFTVNNVPQPFLDQPQPDENGLLLLAWPLQNIDVGAYELLVEVEDELGFTAVTEPFVVTVSVNRPEPATPTPGPTATPPPVAQVAEITAISRFNLLLLLVGVSLLGLVLAMARIVKKYREKGQRQARRQERRAALQRIQQEQVQPEPAGETTPMRARLCRLDDTLAVVAVIPIEADNVTLGRDEERVKIVLTDRAVARFHARLRKRNGRFWLYDEGSETGTYLNYERIGLSPRPLKDGDEIRLGTTTFRFDWKPVSEYPETEAADESEAEVETPDNQAEEAPPEEDRADEDKDRAVE